jgi:hypothetical protein
MDKISKNENLTKLVRTILSCETSLHFDFVECWLRNLIKSGVLTDDEFFLLKILVQEHSNIIKTKNVEKIF